MPKMKHHQSQTNADAGSESEDKKISNDSSCSSNGSSSSSNNNSNNKSSLYSIPDTYKADLYEWGNNFTEKSKQKKHIREGNMKLFYLFMNQCPPQMITELKSTDEFEDFETN